MASIVNERDIEKKTTPIVDLNTFSVESPKVEARVVESENWEYQDAKEERAGASDGGLQEVLRLSSGVNLSRGFSDVKSEDIGLRFGGAGDRVDLVESIFTEVRKHGKEGGASSSEFSEDRVSSERRDFRAMEGWEAHISNGGHVLFEDSVSAVSAVSEVASVSYSEANIPEGVSSHSLEAKVVNEQVTYDCYSPSSYENDADEDHVAWIHGFEKGDMVWGKVKSHPWWPGHIFNEAFATHSVRRSKREGHVLVAFFGDSSYGWFDPAELIQFEPHYEEKSMQTSSRNFVRAVEEAVDEASRRRALGLSCRCRNPFNFRPTSVSGYFAVDVIGYEPDAIYSVNQIKKSRDSLVAVDTVAFLNRLALKPRDAEHGSLGFISNMAMLLSLRKAMFEEFDDTYAQAFGVNPVRPSRDSRVMMEQPMNIAPRAAPLSGPLVFAETLGVKKKSTVGKSVVKATKERTKKDKYLFKRRDDAPPVFPGRPTSPAAAYAPQVPSPGVLLSSPTAPFPSVPEAATPGEIYVLQRRTPADAGMGSRLSTPEGIDSVQVPVGGDYKPGVAANYPPPPAVAVKVEDTRERSSMFGEGMPDQVKVVLQGSGDERRLIPPQASMVDVIEPLTPGVPVSFTDREGSGSGVGGLFSVAAGSGVTQPVDFEMGRFQDSTVSGVVVKEKKKRPRQDAASGPIEGEVEKKKKKKKKKEEMDQIYGADHTTSKVAKIRKGGELFCESAGRSIGIGLSTTGNVQTEFQKVDRGSDRFFLGYDLISSLPKLDLGPQDLDFPVLLSDLTSLALDPYYGNNRKASIVVRHVFLRFRSLVYRKSLVPPPPNELEPAEAHARKLEGNHTTPSLGGGLTVSAGASEGRSDSSKSSMQGSKVAVARLDDPSKAGRKRGSSDRQEEILVKRMKKLDKLKSMTSEKKLNRSSSPSGEKKMNKLKTGLAWQKTAEAPKTTGLGREDPKEKGAAAATLSKTDISKKQPEQSPQSKKQGLPPAPKKEVPSPKAPTPTYLMMKFPPRSTLPSIASLKARFGRFGALDLSGARVYWASYTCKVLFKHRADALAAYNYGVNNDVFGQIKVNYSLRDLEVPDSGKTDNDARSNNDGMQAKLGDVVNDPRMFAANNRQQSVQPKSILKKPCGDEAGPVSTITKESPRVKFMLEGEDNRREPLSAVGDNGNGSGNGMPPLAPPVDLNGKNLRSVNFLPQLPSSAQLSAPLPTLLPQQGTPDKYPLPPPPLPMVQERRTSQFISAKPPQSQFNEGNKSRRVDISFEMLDLLRRCSDIVSEVRSAFGYVPYHPL